MLAIAFCPQLIALVARSADPPPDLPICPRRPTAGTVGLVSLLGAWRRSRQLRVGGADVLVELVNAVLRVLRERVEVVMVHRVLRHMIVGHDARRGQVLVGGEALERVGQHLDGCVRGLRARFPPRVPA
jgi:hypothetical protein